MAAVEDEATQATEAAPAAHTGRLAQSTRRRLVRAGVLIAGASEYLQPHVRSIAFADGLACPSPVSIGVDVSLQVTCSPETGCAASGFITVQNRTTQQLSIAAVDLILSGPPTLSQQSASFPGTTFPVVLGAGSNVLISYQKPFSGVSGAVELTLAARVRYVTAPGCELEAQGQASSTVTVP
jgi:hypothetical protein